MPPGDGYAAPPRAVQTLHPAEPGGDARVVTTVRSERGRARSTRTRAQCRACTRSLRTPQALLTHPKNLPQFFPRGTSPKPPPESEAAGGRGWGKETPEPPGGAG